MMMSRQSTWVLLALALALGGACGGPGSARPRPAQRGSPETSERAPSPAALALRPVQIELDVPALQWTQSSARSGGGRRVALLVAADEYAESAWNLRFARRSADELKRVLVERLGFREQDVQLLSGDGVYPRNVQGTLDDLTAGMSGPGNVLLTLWVGHGFEIGGEQRLLTYRSGASTVAQDGGYSDTLRYDQLTGWLSDASREVSRNGGSLATAMILDACRVETRSAPRRISNHVSRVDVEAFSAPLGQPAPDASADFTALLTRSLDTARGQRVSLLPALRAGRDSIAARNPDSSPEIASGAADITLLDRANLTVTVEAVDASSDPPRPIAGARIELNGQLGSGRDGRATFSGLAASSEGYDLRVLADGYFWRTAELQLPPERSGATVRVGLLPEFVILTGVVQLPGSGMAEVKLQGGFQDLIAEHHSTRVVVSRSGRWQLQVPRERGRRSLVVAPSGGGEGGVVREFDLADMHSTTRTADGMSVSVFDFGFSTLDAAAAEAIVGGGARAAAVGSLTLNFDLASLGADAFVDRNAQAFYAEIAPLVADQKYGRALADIDSLMQAGRVRTGAQAAMTELRHELALADAVKQAEHLRQRGDVSGAIDALSASGVMGDPRVLTVYGAWLLADAAELHGRGEYQRAVGRLAQADSYGEAAGFDRASIRAQLRQAHRDWFEARFEQALENDDWDAAAVALSSARAVLPPEDSADMAARMDRESIPRACREAYREAMDALARGDLERAWESFTLALESGANPYYWAEITSQNRAVGEDLFAKNNRIGAERYQAGDMVGSFNAYLRAWEYDTLVTSRIEQLRQDPAVRRAEPESVAGFPRRAGERRWREQSSRARSALASGRLDDAAELLTQAHAIEHADAAEIDRLLLEVEAARASESRRLEALLGQAHEALAARTRWARLDQASAEALGRNLHLIWPELGDAFAFRRVERHSAGEQAHWMVSFEHRPTGLEFMLIPGGRAQIGSPDGERERRLDETLHGMLLEPFLMASTECTQDAWARLGAHDPSSARGEGLPVQGMTWRGAHDWCKAAGLQLPTEAQWEWACRAGTSTPFWTGHALSAATISRSFSQGPLPAASHPANAFGLHDMHGNVSEWCANPYGGYSSMKWNKLGRTRDNRVARGGGYNASPDDARSARRVELPPEFSLKNLGFRPVFKLVETP